MNKASVNFLNQLAEEHECHMFKNKIILFEILSNYVNNQPKYY